MLDRDEELQARMRQLAQREREQLLRDVIEVLQLPAGRRLLHRLLADSGMYTSTHSVARDGRVDPYATAFHEGQRNQGLMLEALIGQADPEAMIRMQVEHLQAVRSARAQREAAEREAAAAAG